MTLLEFACCYKFFNFVALGQLKIIHLNTTSLIHYTSLVIKIFICSHSANAIISEIHKKKNNDAAAVKKEALKSASKIILSDLSTMNHDKSEYPTADKISQLKYNTDFLPESLVIFLKGLITTKDADLKIASIGQAIVQSAHPRRTITPLQFGLGVLVHHLSGSKFIVQTLNRLGFCSSYDEVIRFGLCASVTEEAELSEKLITDHVTKST